MREVKTADMNAFSVAVAEYDSSKRKRYRSVFSHSLFFSARISYFNLVFGNSAQAVSYWSSTLVDLLNYHFIFRNPLPHNFPFKYRPLLRHDDVIARYLSPSSFLRAHIKLWRLLTRVQEITAITLAIERLD